MTPKREVLYLTADQIDKAVRAMYSKNGYVVLSQVRNGTGYARAPRTADMLVISTWPSRGMLAEGIEIKRDRGDLRRELADPAKADDIAKYCQSWWIAVPEGLITEDMLIPDAWGIITVDDKLKAKVTKRGSILSPMPMDTLFVCSALRNFAESYVHVSEIQPQIQAAREDGRKEAESLRQYRLKELESAVQRLRDEAGIDILTDRGHPVWNMGDIGQAVNLIAALRAQPVAEIASAQAKLRDSIAAIDAALTILSTPLERSAA